MSDINRLTALQKIVETGSFSRAAELTGYTQSAISQMISSLEKELNIKLLSRSRNGIELTIEGKQLYPFLENVLIQYTRAMQKADEINGLETGEIRLATVSSISQNWLPKLIREFKARYPQVDFVILEGDYVSIPEWIKTGQIDFAIISPKADPSLQYYPLKSNLMVAVMPEGHPLAENDVVKLSDLAKENFILLEEGKYHEPIEAFRKAGLKPSISYTLHDDYSIMTMIEQGLGVSVLAELILRRANYRIVTRPTEPQIVREMAIVYKDETSIPVASRRFIQLMKSRQGELL